MFEPLFEKAGIPAGRTILAHVRLKSIHEYTRIDYKDLAKDLLARLLECRPHSLLIPAYTIYSFISSRIFHLEYSRSEVGRFSEEIRRTGCSRSPDPMYSLLDIHDNLPKELNFHRTFGPGSVFEYLREINAVIVNIDMPGFYATPIHCIELEHKPPYRYEMTFDGKMQQGSEPWQNVSYRTYVRAMDPYGSGSYPPYNQKRRLEYLRKHGVITETNERFGHLAWANVSDFNEAIFGALAQDPCFLVDQPAGA